MTAVDIKSELLRVVETLPPKCQAQILEFACFLHRQTRADTAEKLIPSPRIEVRPLPATTLTNLTGLVALGGDSVGSAVRPKEVRKRLAKIPGRIADVVQEQRDERG